MAENSSSSSASSVIEVGSNVDILRQILLCLPVKSLLVFKSVSTQWLSLISHPFFGRDYALRNNSLPIPGLFLGKDSIYVLGSVFDLVFLDGHVNASDISWIRMTIEDEELHIDIKQSCNGLIYFRFQVLFKDCIFNPSTKQIGLLPCLPPSREKSMFSFRNISLAFDPIKSPHYEVVYVSSVPSTTHWPTVRSPFYLYQIDVYSSETKSWRLSGNSFPAFPDTWIHSGVFWNGSVHWISNSLNESFSLYFDVERDIVKTMPMPPVPDGLKKRKIKYFGECKGHLYLIESYDPSASCFDILELDTDYTGWMVKYRVDLTELIIAYPEIVCDNGKDNDEEFLGRFDFSILLVEEGEEKFSRLLVQISDKLVSYDLHNKSFKVIRDLSPGFYAKDFNTYKRYQFAHKYIESLASV